MLPMNSSAGSELEKAHLVAEVVAQVARRDGDRLEVFLFLVLFAAASRRVEAVEENLLPVYLSSTLVLGLGLSRLGFLAFLLLLFFLLDQIEEGIVQQLLLEVLLKVEEGHVEQIHRLIEAWIDLELLAELSRLIESRLH
jgi:hypothetical protein